MPIISHWHNIPSIAIAQWGANGETIYALLACNLYEIIAQYAPLYHTIDMLLRSDYRTACLRYAGNNLANRAKALFSWASITSRSPGPLSLMPQR